MKGKNSVNTKMNRHLDLPKLFYSSSNRFIIRSLSVYLLFTHMHLGVWVYTLLCGCAFVRYNHRGLKHGYLGERIQTVHVYTYRQGLYINTVCILFPKSTRFKPIWLQLIGTASLLRSDSQGSRTTIIP